MEHMISTFRNKDTGQTVSGEVTNWFAPEPGDDPLKDYGVVTLENHYRDPANMTIVYHLGLGNWEMV